AEKDENKIALFVGEDKYAKAKRGDGDYQKAMLVNTFISAEDREAYSVGGYDVVVDTRDAYVYDDFEAYCVSKDGDGLEITYEEYLSLSEAAKKGFEFKIRYTPYEVDLSEAKTLARVDYLKEKDSAAKQAARELETKHAAGETDDKTYANDVWALYVKNYYPDLSGYEKTTGVPLVRNYYYHNYTLAGEKNYLLVFDDSIVGSFTTTDGKTEEFYGFYENFAYGDITDGGDFIRTAFSASFYLSQYVGFVNVMRFLPIYIVMPLVAALIAYLIIRIAEKEKAKRFSFVLKITATFILWSAIFATLITYVLSFFIDRGLIFTTVSVIYFVVIMVRCVIWFTTDITKFKKHAEDDNGNKGETIDSLRG
ncbi:MAG: hypothetical protein ILP02_04625, partial [Clostridia bacterium]|nr:hypothetical protein [Clostridia bacterium]